MKQKTKLIHEGDYVAVVQVKTLEPAPGWESCIPLAEAIRLDEARAALKTGNLREAAKYGQVFRLVPLAS